MRKATVQSVQVLEEIKSTQLTVEDIYIDRSHISSGRAAAVLASICRPTAVDDQHAHQHSRCGLLAHHDTSSRV